MYGKSIVICDFIFDVFFFIDDLFRSFEFLRDYGKEFFVIR